VLYFRFTDLGLDDNNGNVLLSPEGLATVNEGLAQEQRNCNLETRTIATFPLYSFKNEYVDAKTMTADRLVITDVSLKLHFPAPEREREVIICFSQIGRGIGDIRRAAYNPFSWFDVAYRPSTGGEDAKATIYTEKESDIVSIHDAVLKEYSAWIAKFPNSVLR
jgi:hypothetical protein